MTIKIAMVTTVTPETHYSAFLASSLSEKYPGSLLLYVCKQENISHLKINGLIKVWSDNLSYPFEIFRRVIIDKPDVVHIQHEFRMFGGKFGALVFPLLLLLLNVTKVKIVTTIHWVVPPEKLTKEFSIDFGWTGYFLWLQKLFLRFTYFFILKFSNKVIVHTDQNKADIVNLYKGANQQCVVIPHGVPYIKYDDDILPSKQINKKILYFGYLHPRKGLEELIKGYKYFIGQYPNWRLVLSGGIRNIDYKNQLQKLISHLDLSNKITILGPLSGSEIDEQINSADFMVLPYKYAFSASGPFSLAIAHLKPVVATPVGSLVQEVRATNAGIITEGISPEDIYHGLVSMVDCLQNDKFDEFVKSLIKTRNLRSWNMIADLHMKLYIELAEY